METAPTIKPPLRVIEIARRYRVHKDTVYGWINEGVTGPRGQPVKLVATQVGGLKLVMRRDLRAFLEALNGRRPELAARRRKRARSRDAAANADAFYLETGVGGGRKKAARK